MQPLIRRFKRFLLTRARAAQRRFMQRMIRKRLAVPGIDLGLVEWELGVVKRIHKEMAAHGYKDKYQRRGVILHERALRRLRYMFMRR